MTDPIDYLRPVGWWCPVCHMQWAEWPNTLIRQHQHAIIPVYLPIPEGQRPLVEDEVESAEVVIAEHYGDIRPRPVVACRVWRGRVTRVNARTQTPQQPRQQMTDMSETENVEQKADKREPSWVQLDVSSIAPNPGDQVLITFVPGERITLMPAVVKWEPKAAGSEPDYKLAFEAAPSRSPSTTSSQEQPNEKATSRTDRIADRKPATDTHTIDRSIAGEPVACWPCSGEGHRVACVVVEAPIEPTEEQMQAALDWISLDLDMKYGAQHIAELLAEREAKLRDDVAAAMAITEDGVKKCIELRTRVYELEQKIVSEGELALLLEASERREAQHLADIKALRRDFAEVLRISDRDHIAWSRARGTMTDTAHYDDAKVPCQNTTTDSAGRSTCLLALGHDGLCEWSPRRKHYDDAKADAPEVSPEMDTLLTKALEAVDARAGQSAEEWAAGIAPFIVADLDTEGAR